MACDESAVLFFTLSFLYHYFFFFYSLFHSFHPGFLPYLIYPFLLPFFHSSIPSFPSSYLSIHFSNFPFLALRKSLKVFFVFFKNYFYFIFIYSQFYEPDALLADPTDGQIFIELLGKICMDHYSSHFFLLLCF